MTVKNHVTIGEDTNSDILGFKGVGEVNLVP